MFDIAQNLLVRDVDMRVFGVLMVAILVNEIGSAYEIIGIMAVGITWAFLTTPDSKEIINSAALKFEEKMTPLKESEKWNLYGRPLTYLSFVLFIMFLALA
jgi:hypothetical protein